MALDEGAAPYFFCTGEPLSDSAHLSVLAARKSLEASRALLVQGTLFACESWTGAPLCDSALLSCPAA